MSATLIRKDEAVNLIQKLDDVGIKKVLDDILWCWLSITMVPRIVGLTPFDISFIVLTLWRVLDDGAVYDVLRGDLHKHDWFEDDGNSNSADALGGPTQGTADGPWGLRHAQAVACVESLPDSVTRTVLRLVLAKAIMLQIFERRSPAVKLDLLFLVESLGQALLSRAELLNAWRNLAS